MSSPSATIQFGGQTLVLDPSGALYWPAEQTLIVSDLHFEKGSFLAQHGSLIPAYDTQDTLDRLAVVQQRYAPRQLIMLGDSFHDRRAWLRLDDKLRKRILALTGCAGCLWIEGNHDVVLEAHGLGQFTAHHEQSGIVLTHEPMETEQPQIFGHFHPSVTLSSPPLRGRCFVQTEHFLIMPSFGSYTGGLDIRDPVFDEVLQGEDRQLYLLYKGQVHTLPKPKPLRSRPRFRHWQ